MPTQQTGTGQKPPTTTSSNWVYVHDDDDLLELWQNVDTREYRTVRRGGPPLHTIPAREIEDHPLYGPPKPEEKGEHDANGTNPGICQENDPGSYK